MKTIWRVGGWHVNLDAGWLLPRRGVARRRIYPDGRLMAVLGALMDEAGQLVSVERILRKAWPDRVVTRDSVSTAIYQLRQLLNDNPASPAYIRTEPRRGYRLVATVEPGGYRPLTRPSMAAVASLCLLVVGGAVWKHSEPAGHDRPLYIGALRDVTQDAALSPLSDAIDATLFSALVHRNPGRVVKRAGSDASLLRLESMLVACDLGPALVVRLLDVGTGHYLWSKTYALNGLPSEPTLVELVASEVTVVLSKT